MTSSAPAPILLLVLQRLIERTYDMTTGIEDLHRFVLGDRGFARHYDRESLRLRVGSRSWPEAAVLVREEEGRLRLALYYPDSLIAVLESRNPLHGLGSENLDAFAVFVEELDHLLTIADRAGDGRPASLFELELHADVTKYLTARHFLERSVRRHLDRGELGWLRHRLFEQLVPASADPEVQRRYVDADRLASRYCRWLERLEPRARLGEVRHFHRLSGAEAVRRIESFLP